MPVPRSARTPFRQDSVPRRLWSAHRAPSVVLSVTLLFTIAQPLSAQLTDDEVRQALAQALQTIADLEQRVLQLEAANPAEDPLEAQLKRLMIPENPAPPARTVFPSSLNPRIGIYMDAVAESGSREEGLGENKDRFSLRETEIDFRLPVSPFAEGVLITAFEDEGNGDFHTTIEEGYADISIGALFDIETAITSKIGRFRVPFGRNNKLHTHDLMQVNRPYVISQQLGEEGLIGDGVEATFPLLHSESDEGFGRTTTLHVAVVNGEMFTGEESLLNEVAGDAGVELESDSAVLVARASHFVELDELSDIEVGASWLTNIGGDAVSTDMDTDIDPRMYGIDVTWRNRDEENGVGSWLLQGEAIQSDFRYGKKVTPGFPSGTKTQRGVAITAQRQMTQAIYAGMRVGKTDRLGTGIDVNDYTPYITWYADEFFRIRLEGQHLQVSPGDDSNRVLLQFTWNFGAHSPHPYWANR